MSHFNQPNKERKNCVWTTKYKIRLEMCIVQHVEMKSVFTFHPIKILVSTTVGIHSLLPRFEFSLQGKKIDNFVVWRGWYNLFSRKDE